MFNLPVIALIFSNLVPIFGVIFLGWGFANIIFLYWFENIIIGIFTVLKMVLARNLTASRISPISASTPKYFLVAFFIVHYGLFTIGHGMFLLFLFGKQINFQSSLLIAIFSMFLSHGISFIIYYLQPKTDLRTSPALLMFAPYPRVIVVHLTVIFSGLFIMNNVSLLPFIFFILLKTMVDLGSHLFEHSRNNFQGINPIFEKYLINLFKISVNTGKWEKTAKMMDPQDREKIESFYRSRGVDI